MEIFGHRGAKGEAPENTLEGFRYLRALGVNKVELDVRVAADRELVVIHDATLEATTDGQGAVAAHDSAALARLDARGAYRDTTPPTGVPRLAEVLADWPDAEIIQIEVKPPEAEHLGLIADELERLVGEHGLSAHTVVTSLDTAVLQRLRERAPRLARGLVADRDCAEPVALAERYGCLWLCPHWRLCSTALTREAHAAGMQISAWTVNHLELASELEAMNLDSVITDYPSRMLGLAPRPQPLADR